MSHQQEWTVSTEVHLTLPAKTADEARARAQAILNAVDGWPSVDVTNVEEFNDGYHYFCPECKEVTV